MPPSFHQFPDLPPEIRLQIWHLALPLRDRASIFPLRLDCWELRPVPPSDPSHDPAVPDFPRLEFRHDLLAPLRCSVSSLTPLLWASSEARHVAMDWTRRNGFETSGKGMYTRRFNPEMDAVYLPPTTRQDFYKEIFDKLQSPEALAVMMAQQPPQQDHADDGAEEGTESSTEPRKIHPWGAVRRFAMDSKWPTSTEGEWVLLPHFFPLWNRLYILPSEADVPITNTHGRRSYDLEGADNTSNGGASKKPTTMFVRSEANAAAALKTRDMKTFTWEGSGGLLEPLREAVRKQGHEYASSYMPGPDWLFEETAKASMVMLNIEKIAKDLEAPLRNTENTARFEIRPLEPVGAL